MKRKEKIIAEDLLWAYQVKGESRVESIHKRYAVKHKDGRVVWYPFSYSIVKRLLKKWKKKKSNK